MHTILVVDDTKSNIDIVLEILGDSYDILVSLDGQKALEIAQKHPIDLILLDIVMPKMDGYAVCQALKFNTTTKDIPVIFITANTDEHNIETAYNMGCSDYVSKPFKATELKARIQNQLNLKQLLKKELAFNKQMALSELLHNIAHQWRQPLSSISTLSSGIGFQKKLGIVSDEEIIRMCEEITSTTQDLSQTIESFRNLISKSTMFTKFNLKTFIEDNYHLLFGEIQGQNIQVQINVNEELQLESYPNLLLQVLMSVVTNSKDALKESNLQQKMIHINMYAIEDKICIQLKDNALGVSKDIINSLFEPYTTTRHKSKSKGLGLYAAHNIITQQLKGSIEVDNVTFKASEQEQSGALFTLTLPHLKD